VPWEYYCFESELDSTSVQIENNRSFPKVHTTSLLNAYTRGQMLGIHKTALAHNSEENSRNERKRREERMVCSDSVGERGYLY